MKKKSYSKEFKESVIKRMMPPNSVSVPQLCKQTGVSDVTLYQWRKDYRDRAIAAPGDHIKPEHWAAEDKLTVFIETADLNSVQLSEYYRSKGLYPEQIDQWKIAARSGYQHNDQVEGEKIRSGRKTESR